MTRGSARAVLFALLGPLLLLVAGLPTAGGQAEDGPLVFFTLAPDETTTGRTVTADASESRPAEGAGEIVEYAWRWQLDEEFEPGNRTEQHEYSQAGVHVVTLRVTDDEGNVGFANQTVLVRGVSPIAYFTLRTQPEGLGLRAVANATFSTPSRGAERIVSYVWDWGDGTAYEGNVTESHFYATPGEYTVELRVVDSEGRADVERVPVVLESTFLTRLNAVWQARESFFEGALLTLYLAVVSTVVGFTLAVVLALMRVSRQWFLRTPALAYIEFIRGTPLFVQILIVWLVFPQFGVKLPILTAGLVALIINTVAYQAESLRAGIQAIPAGQMEASVSLGLTRLQAMRHVVLPQAFRLAIPALGNEFIILLKDTSLVSVIGVVELTKTATIFSARTFLTLEPFLGIALIYFVMTYSISLALRTLERKLAIPGMGVSGGPG